MPTMYGICKTSSLGKVMNTVHNTQRRENNSQKMLDVNHDLPEAMDICAHDLIAMQAKENYNLLAIYSCMFNSLILVISIFVFDILWGLQSPFLRTRLIHNRGW